MLRWITSNRASLFGLGIPPVQYDALSGGGARPMADVLKERAHRLATGFDLKDNYFAWQAFGRRYAAGGAGPCPPYLDKENFLAIKTRTNRVTVIHDNMIRFLANEPAESLDRYVLLDAQDWMDDAALNALWQRDHAHRPAGRTRHLPHGGRGKHSARPRLQRHPRKLDVRRGAIGRDPRQGSLGHLRRLPPLRQSQLRHPMSDSAAAMDAIYRHQRFIYDLTRRPYLFGRDQMLAGLEPPPGGSVLEIGCGTARNLLCAARLYPDAEFFGIDVSEEMLKTAQASVARSPFRDSIRVAHADATAFCPRSTFRLYAADRIFISYALSMIPAWEAVIERAIGQLAPRGELHIVDFGTMESMPPLPRRIMRAWLARFSVIPRANLESAVRQAASRHGRTATFRQGRLGYAAHACIGQSLA